MKKYVIEVPDDMPIEMINAGLRYGVSLWIRVRDSIRSRPATKEEMELIRYLQDSIIITEERY